MTSALVRFELVPDWERSPAGEEYSHEDVAVIACDAQDRVDLHTPFNSMCNTALAANRDISVCDGYGNARIHHFDQDGKLPNSWDEVGIGPVQSHLPHGIALDSRGIFMPPRCPAAPVFRTKAASDAQPASLATLASLLWQERDFDRCDLCLSILPVAASFRAAPASAQPKGCPMTRLKIAALITGSPNRNHDYDFFRIRLNQALYDAYGIKVDCYQDYEDTAAILGADMLVTYTSQVIVSDPASAALRRYLERGGRWFALHSTNSVAGNQILPRILGTRFISHPPYQKFHVSVTKPDDPLLEGIDGFDVEDELYCMENVTGDVEVLLHTRWGGEGFGNIKFEVEDRPMMYRRKVGEGGILYLALGHANRPYDKPRPDYPDQPDHRGPWEMPVYKTLIQRGVEWVAGRRPL